MRRLRVIPLAAIMCALTAPAVADGSPPTVGQHNVTFTLPDIGTIRYALLASTPRSLSRALLSCAGSDSHFLRPRRFKVRLKAELRTGEMRAPQAGGVSPRRIGCS